MYNHNMVMTKTPLRITFVGGGTDLASYYLNHGPGAVVSAAINKYTYIIANRRFDNEIRVKYSKFEVVSSPEDIVHPLFREALKLLGISRGIEINSISELPTERGGMGLGSSSSFVVGLLNALHAWQGETASAKQLAEEAVQIEREILKEPGGKQDQYIAAFGGIRYMRFDGDESVYIEKINMDEELLSELRSRLLLFYIGIHRSSGSIHAKQMDEAEKHIEAYKKMKELADRLKVDLQNGDISGLGKMLHENWLLKKSLTDAISSSDIDSIYDKAMNAGAEGGKLIGAGGGGFLMFFAEPSKHGAIKKAVGLQEMKFDFETLGSRVIYASE
jgi:D-glycero-alpha-D-manno-heptose-7-phosphate kinase